MKILYEARKETIPLLKKKIEQMSPAELEIREIHESLEALKETIQQIQSIAEKAFIKASISHSLIVVRKISEEKVAELSKLLD